jgi:DNA-binding response OmpR family regulator
MSEAEFSTTSAFAAALDAFPTRTLIIDDDEARANNVAAVLRFMGGEVAVATSLENAGFLWHAADVVIIDDDAFGDDGRAMVSAFRRSHPGTFACMAARWSRFADVRGTADYVLSKPLSSAAIVDAIEAARALT